MYIDTHCHLDFPQFNDDRAMVIGNAKKADVKKFINPGVDYITSERAVLLAEHHTGTVYAAVGYHPYEAQKNTYPEDLEKLISPNVVAIGECGLDYHMYKGESATGKKDNQKRLLDYQVRLALKMNLPVIFHCREAFEDFFVVLDQLPSMPRGVIHCFTGGLVDLAMARERRLFVGIDGNVTYSRHLEMTVQAIDPVMLLLETDSPLLTPVPHRGTRNEPKYIPLIAKKIADLKDIQTGKIAEQTSENARSLFNIA